MRAAGHARANVVCVLMMCPPLLLALHGLDRGGVVLDDCAALDLEVAAHRHSFQHVGVTASASVIDRGSVRDFLVAGGRQMIMIEAVIEGAEAAQIDRGR